MRVYPRVPALRCLPLQLDVAVLFRAVPFQVYVTCPAFLQLLEGELEPTFWNHKYDSQQFFLNFKGILEVMPSYMQFHFCKQEEITKGQIR
jgi:hypothetical protein